MSSEPPIRRRHRPGSWYDLILRALAAEGGTASLGAVYNWIEEHGHLKPSHLTPSTNGHPRYRHIVRTYVRELWERGEVERVGRGGYRLPKHDEMDQP